MANKVNLISVMNISSIRKSIILLSIHFISNSEMKANKFTSNILPTFSLALTRIQEPTQDSQGSYPHQASRSHPQQNRRVWPAWPLPTLAEGGDQRDLERLTQHASRPIPLPARSAPSESQIESWQMLDVILFALISQLERKESIISLLIT